jgi:hypothetical protein
VHIGAISVLDNRHNALNISGDLAIREREIGGVQIDLRADDFKVIDNKMGNVRIYSALLVTGELRAPRVDGDLGITTGQIDLDPILAKLGDSAYSTEQTEFATSADAAAAEQGIGDQSRTNFIIEYEIRKWMRLQTNVLQGSSTQQNLFQRAQGSGVDLLLFFSY